MPVAKAGPVLLGGRSECSKRHGFIAGASCLVSGRSCRQILMRFSVRGYCAKASSLSARSFLRNSSAKSATCTTKQMHPCRHAACDAQLARTHKHTRAVKRAADMGITCVSNNCTREGSPCSPLARTSNRWLSIAFRRTSRHSPSLTAHRFSIVTSSCD